MGIALENVSFTYQEGTPLASTALSDVSLTIEDGSYTALIGHTGSGKSTILQLLNGLLVPSQGSVRVFDTLITSTSKNKDIRQIRKQVGLVFQFAENQIFEETVLKDVALDRKILEFLKKMRSRLRVRNWLWLELMNHFLIVVRLSYQVDK